MEEIEYINILRTNIHNTKYEYTYLYGFCIWCALPLFGNFYYLDFKIYLMLSHNFYEIISIQDNINGELSNN